MSGYAALTTTYVGPGSGECHEGKRDVVVDFTNNAARIIKAFAKYREGTPYAPTEPDQAQCVRLYREILDAGVFSQDNARSFAVLVAEGNDAAIQAEVQLLRLHFKAAVVEPEGRKAFVHLLGRFVGSFHFLSCFFSYDYALREFVDFAEVVGPQLIKAGTESELMKQVRASTVVRASVQEAGTLTRAEAGPRSRPRTGGGGGSSPPERVSIDDMLEKFRQQFPISDEEALFIRQVTEEKASDPGIRATVLSHHGDPVFLGEVFRKQVKAMIQTRYNELGRYDELTDEKYTDDGAIFDIMAVTVIEPQAGAAHY